VHAIIVGDGRLGPAVSFIQVSAQSLRRERFPMMGICCIDQHISLLAMQIWSGFTNVKVVNFGRGLKQANIDSCPIFLHNGQIIYASVSGAKDIIWSLEKEIGMSQITTDL